MKILLLQDVKKLGHKGAIVDVADGYATSALIPTGKARAATSEVIAQAKRAQAHAVEQERAGAAWARETARKLTDATITITAKAEGEKLFGSIGAEDVAAALKKEYTVDITAEMVDSDYIKTVGTHTVVLDLGADVTCTVHVDVVAQ